MKFQPLLPSICALARNAGTAILAIYDDQQRAAVQIKADGSPLTLADQLAERILMEGLRALTPDVPVVAEEAHAKGERPDCGSLFWLVDALDGSREFVDRNGQFTVNVALIENGKPALGVVYAPALDSLYAGVVEHEAFVERAGQRLPIRCRPRPTDGVDVVGSRSHADAAAMQSFLASHQVRSFVAAGSSLKFCMVAEGRADLYPRLGRTMEWDTAAGHAVLAASGGAVLTLNGEHLRYGKDEYENPHFVACGS